MCVSLKLAKILRKLSTNIKTIQLIQAEYYLPCLLGRPEHITPFSRKGKIEPILEKWTK